MLKKQVITEAEIPAVIARFERGEFVSIIFTKADGTRRTATAQFGVANPTNAPAPKGTGESAKEALTRGRVKFFDASVENPDGTHGDNEFVALYKGQRCSAIFNYFNWSYYVDDIYGIINQ